MRLLEPVRRTRALLIACLLWIVGCTGVALAPQLPPELLVPYLFGAATLTTVAGMIAGTTAVALAAASSPAAMLGRSMALFELAWGIAGAMAPAMFAWLYAAGPARPWGALIVPVLLVSPLLLWLEARLPAHALTVSRRRRSS